MAKLDLPLYPSSNNTMGVTDVSSIRVKNGVFLDTTLVNIEEDIKEVQQNLSGVLNTTQNVSGLVTIEELNDKLSGYAKSEDIPSVSGLVSALELIDKLGGYAKSEDVPSVSGLVSALELIDKLGGYAKSEDIPSVSGLVSAEELNDKLSGYVKSEDIPSISGLVSAEELSDKLSGYIKSEDFDTKFEELSGYVLRNEEITTQAIKEIVDSVSGVVLITDLNNILEEYAKKSDIPQGGGSVDVDLSDFVTATDVQQYIQSLNLVNTAKLNEALQNSKPSGYVLQSEYDEMVSTFSGLIFTLSEDIKVLKENAITIG